ncbi:zinc metalloproteinase nas-13 [Lingula anatina]|uniref:Metalloendopeptidase n=1 Tax=Lingula anatina TaxID=7574 RepID=A0A1S3KCD5_LINAN|nr:zinc metalloproteinase nas-13 [Lingula anatina]|eukprot:XP_013420157.1 zinc metalloproteinase nas-13 [Lingula anatina]
MARVTLAISSLRWLMLIALLLDSDLSHRTVAKGFLLSEGPDPKDPEEAGKFEGDIDISSDGLKRNVILSASKWKNGTVFYEIDQKYVSWQSKAITSALREFERLVNKKGPCIHFLPRFQEKDYVFISPVKPSCYSKLGRDGGKQVTSLGIPCLYLPGKVMHEMMHVLGFLHEQSRTDRDGMVKIAWENIEDGHAMNFDKYNPQTADGLNLPYDFGSVMHYSEKAFSKNGRDTIIPRVKGVMIGQRITLSELDVKKVRHYYNCDKSHDLQLK